jgi:hypothetical protein
MWLRRPRTAAALYRPLAGFSTLMTRAHVPEHHRAERPGHTSEIEYRTPVRRRRGAPSAFGTSFQARWPSSAMALTRHRPGRHAARRVATERAKLLGEDVVDSLHRSEPILMPRPAPWQICVRAPPRARRSQGEGDRNPGASAGCVGDDRPRRAESVEVGHGMRAVGGRHTTIAQRTARPPQWSRSCQEVRMVTQLFVQDPDGGRATRPPPGARPPSPRAAKRIRSGQARGRQRHRELQPPRGYGNRPRARSRRPGWHNRPYVRHRPDPSDQPNGTNAS